MSTHKRAISFVDALELGIVGSWLWFPRWRLVVTEVVGVRLTDAVNEARAALATCSGVCLSIESTIWFVILGCERLPVSAGGYFHRVIDSDVCLACFANQNVERGLRQLCLFCFANS